MSDLSILTYKRGFWYDSVFEIDKMDLKKSSKFQCSYISNLLGYFTNKTTSQSSNYNVVFKYLPNFKQEEIV